MTHKLLNKASLKGHRDIYGDQTRHCQTQKCDTVGLCAMDLVFRYPRATITVLWTASDGSGNIGKQRTETVILTLYSGRKRYAILPSPPGSCMTAESYRELVSMNGEVNIEENLLTSIRIMLGCL